MMSVLIRSLVVFGFVCVSLLGVAPFFGVALAGEKLIGTLIVSDGGTVTNRTSGYTNYACPANTTGGCFLLPVGVSAYISVQCDQASYVLTDVAGCDAGQCLKLAADQLLTTSVNTVKNLSAYVINSDGGAALAITYNGGWIASAPVSGASSVCRVFDRRGNE